MNARVSLIQSYQLDEVDYRADRFADHPVDILGNNKAFNLTCVEDMRFDCTRFPYRT